MFFFKPKSDERIHRYRANWTYQRLTPLINKGARVLNVGAGDCRVDQLLAQAHDCDVVSVDVVSYNETPLPLIIYDGRNLPFPDNSFDVVLLIFTIHHAEDPSIVLQETMRVCRGKIIAFEDVVESMWDRLVYRGFHRFLRWSQGIPLPNFELTLDQWTSRARAIGLKETARLPIGRTFGYFASRHVAFI